MTIRSPIRHFALALTLLCIGWAPLAAAQAPVPEASLSGTLAQARQTCFTEVGKTLTPDPSPKLTVEVLRRLAGEDECPKITLEPSWDVVAVLDVVASDLDKASGEYGCTPVQARAVCQGIEAARIRQQHLRLLQTGKTSKLRDLPDGYTRSNATEWSGTNDSFGVSATFGTSFMRLALLATDPNNNLVRLAEPNVPYFNLRDDILNATNSCRGCGEEVARVISLYSIFDTLDRVFMKIVKTSFNESVKELTDLDARWQAYHFGGGQGRAQLPWELAVNSVIYDKFLRDEKTTRPEPPKGALILLHPSPGLAMKDVKGASMVVNAVEVLGGSFWSYSKTGSRKNEIGASLVAAYRQRDDAKNWGYGVLVRTPLELSSLPINIVWTRTKLNAGGHDDTVALSVDISRYVPKWKNAACLFKLPSCEKGS